MATVKNISGDYIITVASGTGNLTINADLDLAGNVTVIGHQVFGNVALPANVANSVVLYSNTVGLGGTGLYFTSATAAGELVSKTKAIVFGIIF